MLRLLRLARATDRRLGMTHRKDIDEERAIRLLEQVVDIDRRDRDALPGSAVSHVKAAIKIMRKRRRA